MTPTQRKAMQQALQAFEAIVQEMTVGERYTNAGQFVIDSLPVLRMALAEPAPEPVAHLWQHVETGRTRVLMPDSVTDCDASWQFIGPLYPAATVREPAPEPVAEVAMEWPPLKIVIASIKWLDSVPVGTKLYAAPVREPVPLLTDEEYTALAHRIASKYAHRSDPKHIAYTFLPHTLEQFVRAIEALYRQKAGL